MTRRLSGPEAVGNAGLKAVSPPPAWPGFYPLAVTAIERESASWSPSTGPTRTEQRCRRPAGPVLTLCLNAGESARPLLRSYSLSGRQAPLPTGSV
jgi:hypothetical protein